MNPSNGNVVYAGIREFTAEEEEISLSGYLRQVLGLEDEGSVTIHVAELAKGCYVKLRPLEAGYDADWKPLLERHMRNTFTTLTKGEILNVPSGGLEYRFLVDELEPEGDAVCIVDTDLEVDIEALNEEQARETLKRKLEAKTSSGGEVEVGKDVSGQVSSGDYVDYTLKKWDRSRDLEIELISSAEVDLYVSPYSARQRSRPREDQHVFAAVEGYTKRVKIKHTNSDLDHAEELYISVHGLENAAFSIKIGIESESVVETSPNPDDAQCKNCGQWVPKRTMMLHENFCFRNNIQCPKCKVVFQKSSEDWKNHWHCPHDESYGSSTLSHEKHDSQFHKPRICNDCGYQNRSVLELAQHRTTTCPAKMILCQFCHLLVPQQGPEDLDPNDPEVILSGLTPHELNDGSRTTECHMCSKIVRLRDMAVHLRHHNLERLSRITPQICRNVNCGRTLDNVSSKGEVKKQRQDNDILLCSTCFGPLYNSAYDPDGKALCRRVERRYLTQFLTGCGQDWCRNEYCKTARQYLGLPALSSKEGLQMVKPDLDELSSTRPIRFCTDEPSQKRRVLGEMIAAEGIYDLAWVIVALVAEQGDLGKARTWLENWAPTKAESGK